ncbi:MAG: phosphate--AMP phosphotransferase [Thermoplasmata archaeon]|nr:phosphate--AMP phosphotransferase [Thermoplasmata archaeon]
MLEDIDFKRTVDPEEYRALIDALEIKVAELHRRTKDAGIPVIIVFEGWDASGKATMINRLLLAMDPRIFTVHPITAPTAEESARPWLWRFWTKTPSRGRIAIFDKSWYYRVMEERVDHLVDEERWMRAYGHINSFERNLVDDGNVLIKFFLHVTEEVQEKRLRKLRRRTTSAWRLIQQEWKHHKHYDDYLEAIEDMLEKTDTRPCTWHIVPSHDERTANVRIFETVIESLEKGISSSDAPVAGSRAAPTRGKKNGKPQQVLPRVDLSLTMDEEEYDRRLKACQEKLVELSNDVKLAQIPVSIMYSGWDAAGKGGNIKRLVQRLDPRSYKVIPIIVPTDEELAHHHLWRFWRELPPAGRIAIFDRSWYGRVLVERIEGYCREDEWRRAYHEINEMEQQWTDDGMVLIKFFLHIDKETQLERFRERENIPHKRWKITEDDWRNREKWGLYEEAIEDMLRFTDTKYAPWTIIESNSKMFSRIRTLEKITGDIERAL